MAKKNQARRGVKKSPKQAAGVEQPWSLLTWPVDLGEAVTMAEAAISQIQNFCAIEGRPETSYRIAITTSNMLGRRQVRGGMRRLWAVVNPSEPSVDPEVLMHTVRLHEREKKQREQEVDQREQKEVTGFTLEEISAYNNLRLIVDRIGTGSGLRCQKSEMALSRSFRLIFSWTSLRRSGSSRSSNSILE